MKNLERVLIVMLISIALSLCACGLEESYKKDDEADVVGESQELEEETGKEEQGAEKEGATFVPDYIENEENKVMAAGKVVGQGRWIYYFTSEEILKMDENENIYVVYSIPNVTEISVLGDWIYYATSSEIGKVRTDGTNYEIVVKTSIYGDFLVKDNILCFVEQYNVSATSKNYIIRFYNMESKEEELVSNASKYRGHIVGFYDECVYICAHEGEDESLIMKINMNTFEIGEEDDIVVVEGICGGFIYGNRLFHSENSGWSDSVTNIHVVNLDEKILEYTTEFEFGKDNSQMLSTGEKVVLCGACEINDAEYWIVRVGYAGIYLVSIDEAKKTLPNRLPIRKIVEEDATQVSIYDSWVVGEYVYYLGSENSTSHLYRIKVDGTNWRQLY